MWDLLVPKQQILPLVPRPLPGLPLEPQLDRRESGTPSTHTRTRSASGATRTAPPRTVTKSKRDGWAATTRRDPMQRSKRGGGRTEQPTNQKQEEGGLLCALHVQTVPAKLLAEGVHEYKKYKWKRTTKSAYPTI